MIKRLSLLSQYIVCFGQIENGCSISDPIQAVVAYRLEPRSQDTTAHSQVVNRIRLEQKVVTRDLEQFVKACIFLGSGE